MRNDGQKPQKPTNGFIPTSFRTLSGYLRTVSSGASSVASSVRSAGASVASSIVDRDGDASCDQVLWAGFDKLECEGDNIRQVLLLGYQSGFQVWDVEEADNVRELASRHDGPVSFLQMQPKPIASKKSADKFEDFRPLLVVVGDGSSSGVGNTQDGLGPSYNGNVTGSHENGNVNFLPSVVRFYSLRSQSYVHVLKFRSAVYTLRCSPRVVAISQEAQIHCFDAATLEREYTILTYPIASNCLGSGGIGYGPLAVGPRWIAYSGYPVVGSDTGRVSPQHLTHSTSFSGSPTNGSLVAHYAKESSKQLAAGIVTLGDIGYKKLSRYCSELLPDNSLKSGSLGCRINGGINGHSPDTDNAGMVIVRDIVCKSVIAQFRAHKSPISALCFDPSGILLVTASVQGHNINVFRIMPSCPGSSSGSDSGGSYVHLYKLQRGFTNAVIQDISFSEDSQWIMISSSRGTNHLFAISPSGGTVHLHSTDGSTNSNTGFGVTTKPMVRSSTGPPKLNQQNLCASGPPVTLSVVSRIKNGNNGWIGTVSGAAAAATGRASSLSGAIASAFHNCKRNDVYAEITSSRTKYHLLVFSPGSVIQYVLRPSSGPDSGTVLSGLSTSFESSPDSDTRLVVEALQKWDIRRRRNRREREDNIDIYGEHGNGDSSKIFPEGIIRGASNCFTDRGVVTKAKISAEDRHHLYISEAELQMHQSWIPLWAKHEIYFHMIMMDELQTKDESALGGETEIESIPTRMIAARSKDLIPVYDYLQTQKLQHSRIPALDSNRSGPLPQQKSGLSEDGRFSYRCSCSSLDCMSEGGAAVAELQNVMQETGLSSPRMSKQSSEGFVNKNGSPMKTQLEHVNNRESPKMDIHLESVYNNRESLKMDNHFEGVDHEVD
ncbi:WD40 repeat [Macleaya cordata]|uniref:WD40 repeat n=1 Tax=Macleaya cordata TaxID=56857 RepID=A0A200QKW0_MACCD|nr:WD40 repeat [Macleaya cordata]